MRTNIIYVSGALTDVPENVRPQYLRFYERIGDIISALGLFPYIPHKHTDPIRHKNVAHRDVDLIDRTAVTSSLLVVAVVDTPSFGVGVEIEMANHAAKPVILLCHQQRLQQNKLSRLIRGNPSILAEIHYHTEADALKKLRIVIEGYIADRKTGILPVALS